MKELLQRFAGRVVQGPVLEELEREIEAAFAQRSAVVLDKEAKQAAEIERLRRELEAADGARTAALRAMPREEPTFQVSASLSLEDAVRAGLLARDLDRFGGQVISRKAFAELVAQRDRAEQKVRTLRRDVEKERDLALRFERLGAQRVQQLTDLGAEHRATTAALRATARALVEAEAAEERARRAERDVEILRTKLAGLASNARLPSMPDAAFRDLIPFVDEQLAEGARLKEEIEKTPRGIGPQPSGLERHEARRADKAAVPPLVEKGGAPRLERLDLGLEETKPETSK